MRQHLQRQLRDYLVLGIELIKLQTMKPHTMKYFEQGGVKHQLNVTPHAKKGGGVRGDIVGCSVASRRRLRNFLLQNEGQGGGEQWALTLTVRFCASPVEWRNRWVSYRRFIIHQGIPFVWRVELQKRGVPHLHCLLWGGEFSCDLFREQWLKLWGVQGDPSHREHAVMFRLAGGGWYGYMILHNQKHMDGQGNEWRGRQWGVVNAKLFKRRDCEQWELNDLEYQHCRKMLDRFYKRRGRKKSLPEGASWDHVGGDRLTVSLCVERSKVWYQRKYYSPF